MPSIPIDDDKKRWINELLGDLSKSSATKQVAVGAASGWVTGYLTMKVGKVLAVAVGGTIIVLQIAQHKGYIKIDWDKVTKTADKVADRIEKEATGQGPSTLDKVERYVDRKLDQVDRKLNRAERKSRSWFGSLFNNGGKNYELQELHIFLVSYVAGLALGVATA